MKQSIKHPIKNPGINEDPGATEQLYERLSSLLPAIQDERQYSGTEQYRRAGFGIRGHLNVIQSPEFIRIAESAQPLQSTRGECDRRGIRWVVPGVRQSVSRISLVSAEGVAESIFCDRPRSWAAIRNRVSLCIAVSICEGICVGGIVAQRNCPRIGSPPALAVPIPGPDDKQIERDRNVNARCQTRQGQDIRSIGEFAE